MFIVSLPFAVLRGGYWAIAAMIGIAHICCHTGRILVDCLYEDVDVYEGEENGPPPPRPPPPTRPENISWEDDSKYQSTDVSACTWPSMQPAGRMHSPGCITRTFTLDETHSLKQIYFSFAQLKIKKLK
jgi:hypothetical protein